MKLNYVDGRCLCGRTVIEIISPNKFLGFVFVDDLHKKPHASRIFPILYCCTSSQFLEEELIFTFFEYMYVRNVI